MVPRPVFWIAYAEINRQVYKHSGTYTHLMNDLTIAFAVPIIGGNAQPRMFRSILQYRVGEITDRDCRVVSGSVE